MFYDTETFEITDIARFKAVLDLYREKLAAMGASDVKLFRNIDVPGQVSLTMWWPTVEACKAFAQRYHAEIGEKIGPITKSMEPDVLWVVEA